MGEFMSLDVRPDLEQAPWTDLDPAVTTGAELVGLGLLRNGTTQGRAAVVLRVQIPVPDGEPPVVLLVQTSWRLFSTAARALAASPTAAEEGD